MSQVVVTQDNLKARRIKSGEQEHNIDIEGEFKKWQLSDITGFDPIAAVIGLAMLPILASFYVIGGVVKIAIYFAISVSHVVGLLIGPTKKS